MKQAGAIHTENISNIGGTDTIKVWRKHNEGCVVPRRTEGVYESDF